MVFLIVLVVLPVLVVMGNDISQERGFTRGEKQFLIDLHNHYRARVARGEERGQPKATNMVAMVSTM